MQGCDVRTSDERHDRQKQGNGHGAQEHVGLGQRPLARGCCNCAMARRAVHERSPFETPLRDGDIRRGPDSRRSVSPRDALSMHTSCQRDGRNVDGGDRPPKTPKMPHVRPRKKSAAAHSSESRREPRWGDSPHPAGRQRPALERIAPGAAVWCSAGFGLPMPRRRTFAQALQAFAHSDADYASRSASAAPSMASLARYAGSQGSG